MRFEYVNFIFVAGPTPGLSSCYVPTLCDTFANCDAMCRKAGFPRGMCTEIELILTCCCM